MLYRVIIAKVVVLVGVVWCMVDIMVLLSYSSNIKNLMVYFLSLFFNMCGYVLMGWL